MKNLETFEDSCEYYLQPSRIFRPFVADIYESANLEPQSVLCYPICVEDGVADVEIKMPILVRPCGISDDVAASLYSEYGLALGNLKFELAPLNTMIYP